MIRHWCDAVGDTNPVYTDPDAAAKSAHGQIIAPEFEILVPEQKDLRIAVHVVGKIAKAWFRG